MKRLFPILLLLSLLAGCHPAQERSAFKESMAKVTRLMEIQDYEQATNTVLETLSEPLQPVERAAALNMLASIDLMTWRDSQAWEHAQEAENLARRAGIDSLIADALVQKGRVCSYAGTTEEEARDDEALAYFMDALSYARSAGSIRREVDILYNLSQVYVNKNRFNDILDKELYANAGRYLEEGVKLARSAGLKDLEAKSLHFKIRYLRQAGRTKEAIACCREIYDKLPPTDYLMQSQILNQLVMLYTADGKAEEAAAAHQQYTNSVEHYMRQKADDRLQEMESRYQASVHKSRAKLRGTWIILLSLLAIVLTGGVIQSYWYSRKLARKNKDLETANLSKEHLLYAVSRDLTSPEYNKKVTATLRGIGSLSEKQVQERCEELFPDDAQLAGEVAGYITDLSKKRQKSAAEFGLSLREMEILRHANEGLSAAEIADKMFISVHTVNNHKQNIYSKMGVRSNAEMLAKAREAGLL